ncbi:MAG: GNAT family N-acetyltransferase [Nitriliruptoraceae bacterium]
MRRAVPLTGDVLAGLPDPCRRCLFWEHGAPCPQPRSGNVLAGLAPSLTAREVGRDAHERKRSWVDAEVAAGHPPGVVLWSGAGRDPRPTSAQGVPAVAGFALFATADRVAPRAAPAPHASADALLLATAWVSPTERSQALGRVLLHQALRVAVRRDLAAVEAYGDRRFRERACLLPATWLLHEGFRVHREHPRVPLLRLETRRLARWTEQLEHAWDEVLGHLPELVPAPRQSGTVARTDGSMSRHPTGPAPST